MRHLFVAIGFAFLWAGIIPVQAQEPSETFFRARVIDIVREERDDIDGIGRMLQTVRLRIESGAEDGYVFETQNGIVQDRTDMRLSQGERVIVGKSVRIDGSVEYFIREKYRLPSLLWLLFGFFVLAVVLGGITGVRSLIGLGVSIAILVFYVVPKIAAGGSPMQISLIGSFVIACTSLYLAHGFNRRTSVALVSTLFTLGLSCLLALLFVNVGKLFGMGSEESIFLQIGPLQSVNLKGLLLGGIIIGCLGVLDDITTAQTAAIDEIRKANPSLTPAQLHKAGMSVGREHIASLINTLALAYAGASLPLLLLFTMQNDYPLWVTLNSEALAEEIVRTLVGSATLILAVPISTWFAVTLLPKRGTELKGHFHAH